MKKSVAIVLVCLFSFAHADAMEQYISERLGCLFVKPTGWTLDTSSTDEIIITTGQNPSAIILIRRYFIESRNQIKSDNDLTEAIAGLYKSLGIESTEPDQIEFSPEGNRMSFMADFKAYEESRKRTVLKSLKGSVARLLDGRQVLYLIIAESAEESYDIVLPDFNLVISSFDITEKLSQNLYPRQKLPIFLFILLILALIVFFFARNRRVQKSKNPLGRDSGSFWRCISCGLTNHIDNRFCSRCGEERVSAELPKR